MPSRLNFRSCTARRSGTPTGQAAYPHAHLRAARKRAPTLPALAGDRARNRLTCALQGSQQRHAARICSHCIARAREAGHLATPRSPLSNSAFPTSAHAPAPRARLARLASAASQRHPCASRALLASPARPPVPRRLKPLNHRSMKGTCDASFGRSLYSGAACPTASMLIAHLGGHASRERITLGQGQNTLGHGERQRAQGLRARGGCTLGAQALSLSMKSAEHIECTGFFERG